VENVGIERENLTSTVRTLSAKPGKRSLKNAVFTVNDKTRRKTVKMTFSAKSSESGMPPETGKAIGTIREATEKAIGRSSTGL